ncbi:MAG: O-antigen ligase family protein [Candidatus Peregrinibacteria bacterium]
MKITKTLLYITLFLLQAYLVRFNIGPYPSNLSEILIGLTAIAFFAETIKEKSFIQKLKNLKKHWIILSLAGLTILSIIIIPVHDKTALLRNLKFLFFGIIIGLIFLETFRKNEERKTALKFAGLGAIAFGIFSVIYNLLGYNVAPDLRLLGPLDAAVYLAYYLTPFFIFFTIQSIENRKSTGRFITTDFICALLLLILILATRSMGALGGSFLVLLIYSFKKNHKHIASSRLARLILASIAILISLATFYTKILPTIQTDYSSLDERGEIWATSLDLLSHPKNLLLGVGFGQFEDTYIKTVDTVLGHRPLDYYVIQPHDIFLLFVFNYGILGLAFIIFCIYKTISRLAKSRTSKTSPLSASEISLFILLYFFIHGLIDTPFYKNDLMILLIIFLEMGLTSPLRPHALSPETKSSKAA